MRNLVNIDGRLKNIIASDRKENPCKIEKLLKAEIINVIRNYFEVSADDVNLSILINKNGEYDIQLNVLSKNFLIANTFA